MYSSFQVSDLKIAGGDAAKSAAVTEAVAEAAKPNGDAAGATAATEDDNGNIWLTGPSEMGEYRKISNISM